MHDLPRQKLSELLTNHGLDLCDDSKKLEGLLKDSLRNEHKRETFVLISALREGVAHELRGSTSGMPSVALAVILTRQLCDNLALDEAAARWSVESWALALGIVITQPKTVPITTVTRMKATGAAPTLSAVQVRAIYEKSITLADTSRAEAVQAAKDDALTELASALDTSLKNKNRKEANVITAALKSLTENSVLEAGALPAVDTIKEVYEGRVVSAQKQYTEQISPAKTKYLASLETAMDAAFVAKDLEEVNRIDAAIEPLRAELARVESARLAEEKRTLLSAIESKEWDVVATFPSSVLATLPPSVLATLPPFKNTIDMSFKRLSGGPGGAFSIGVHEVTQSEYESVMGSNPSHFKGANNPVERVSFDDVVEFCEKLSSLPGEVAAGRVYRLPSEAEWEYACRAGTTTAYSFGDDAQDLGWYAWYGVNSGSTTHGVGEKLPNGWGLYDMYGNVWEWCSDVEGSSRVCRGGSWADDATSCRAALRSSDDPTYRYDDFGFRLALSSVK